LLAGCFHDDALLSISSDIENSQEFHRRVTRCGRGAQSASSHQALGFTTADSPNLDRILPMHANFLSVPDT